ncbi:heavy metal translocating P-type ATPase [Butyricicoccus pullicaecorum]|uniref:Cd(2+)-exporting ATPase n=1 Tax=Butyricicoccus pullicaecorum 1.2 TaxID=1203606 RepID=R8W3W9_9FIRM|nr:heavy metal translocating P-type ATPase [Butyricicoccus pullicaecorum]EOQ37847.1 heavy metal translocating P-type ATPase [Butyricicoccus pullicaecorum 1.2]SKA60431.1 ATPase, P-type (transporting), HAD superfamily, subfamily IC/heavy metal translocating P-type ATPase [Butyricicoccus pullicaecorum DSM 23266]HJF51696.1 heavy metal translocating P-type ATPase [Butyricicoccus pullicaecorum]
MNATILHESRGRIRLRLKQKQMSLRQADLLQEWLDRQTWVQQATVHERTCCVIVRYRGTREQVLDAIRQFSWQQADRSITLPAHSSRQLNRDFEEKLVGKVLCKAACTLFLPSPLRIARIVWQMIPFLRRGIGCMLRRQLKVEVLDALSIGISAFRRDFGTAGAVMFLLEVGELLEEWTRKKSVEDLARCMALGTDRVWLHTPDGDILTPIAQIVPGDQVVIRAGGVIPVDGLVLEGEATVNQASLTGESIPVAKHAGSLVYAGTAVEEGECLVEVRQASGQSRYDQIVSMIERSEQMKSAAENKAVHLSDRLVPYTFAGSLLSLALTRNPARALSVLMVDFSCALKLAMPLAVLSAMREAGSEHITVKGGKFLEAVAQADTIVFDKTGTLTHACPQVAQVIPFGGTDEQEMLRLAACLEEHFPHSMANAVVEEAKRRGLTHEEFHSKVEYLVAHGIVSTVNGERVRIGSAHFIFEDEGCVIPKGEQERFDALPAAYSHLYLAVGQQLAAVICISDPLRAEARDVLSALRALGISQTVMLTGDSRRTAAAIASEVGVDTFRAEVLPADKAQFIAELRAAGHTVLMVGDGINDSPALSEADAGIAIRDGAAIAREIADITLSAESLWELVKLRQIAVGLMARIRSNYRFVIGFNGTLIALGVAGILSPAASAALHNLSTLGVSLRSMQSLPKPKIVLPGAENT